MSSSTRRAAIYKLASAAYEMDLEVMSGVLQQAGDGRWLMGDKDLHAWLEKHQGEDLVIVLGSLTDDRTLEPRTCRTCGREYMDLECPHCRANRLRLRGRA